MDLHAYFAVQATRCRTDADYMALALVAAEISGAHGEVPVGAVLVHKDRGFLARNGEKRAVARGNGGHRPGLSGTRRLAADRMHVICDAGAVSDVRRGDLERADLPRRLWG